MFWAAVGGSPLILVERVLTSRAGHPGPAWVAWPASFVEVVQETRAGNRLLMRDSLGDHGGRAKSAVPATNPWT
jgi:hypothetical protein